MKSPKRKISFTTAPDIRQRLRDHIAQPGVTVADAILDAIEATAPELDELLTPHRPRIEQGPLFQRTVAADANRDEVRAQVSLRLPEDAIGIIDRLVDKHRAKDRSQPITAALDRYLKNTRTPAAQAHDDRRPDAG